MRMIVILVIALLLTVAPTLSQNKFELQCGDILESELFPSQSDDLIFDEYVLDVSGGTTIDLAVVPLGQNFNVGFVVQDAAGTDLEFHNLMIEGIAEELQDFVLGGSNQIIQIYGTKPSSVGEERWIHDRSVFFANVYAYAGHFLGAYQVSLGCTLRDGTVIEPGVVLESITVTESSDSPTGVSGTLEQTQPVKPEFSGFGFPGFDAVDFSAGIEIPIQLGQPQTAPIGGDIVALYTYDATADSTATLSLSRVSGDIAVGVSVIQRDTNEIVFVGGMPSSNNLSVELMFPSDGTYVIGLFRMDTAEKMDTSGAVQVMIE